MNTVCMITGLFEERKNITLETVKGQYEIHIVSTKFYDSNINLEWKFL